MTKTITNKEDMKEFLQECGWRKSALFNDWFSYEPQYIDTHCDEKINYGIGGFVSCDVSYPICVVQSYDPHDLCWYWVIKQNGISINVGYVSFNK